MTVLLWSPDAPTRCMCDGAYQPQLNRHGRLVMSRDPAWRMFEQTRDPECLQERFRAGAKLYRLEYQHHTTSVKSGAGYPDVHMWAAGRESVYVELKRMGRDPTVDQVRRMASLLSVPHRVFLARPCCLLVGAVDELLAEVAGTRCLYALGRRPAGPAPDPTALGNGSVTATPAPAPAHPRPHRLETALPGAPAAEPFPSAVGYVVPLTGDADAMGELEQWLRGAGFAPSWTPFPIRFVAGPGTVAVQVRRLDGERVWRCGTPPAAFPDDLAERLRADVIAGPSSDRVMSLIEAVPASAVMN